MIDSTGEPGRWPGAQTANAGWRLAV